MTGCGGHGPGGIAVVMRRPDGTPMSRQEVIIQRRGAFKWLPVLCSNDLVHGSWWFVLGSGFSMLFAVIPIIQQYYSLYEQEDDLLPRIDYDVTWAMLIICGFFYTMGSWAFVRAFEEPHKQALFHYYKHLQSDELLGAWLFLAGTAPAVPYCFVFFTLSPSIKYLVALLGSIVAVFGCILFVLACYPSDRKVENYLLPICLRVIGPRMWIVVHLANDWLAGTWFVLWANGAFCAGTFLILIVACATTHSSEQIFVWTSTFINGCLFQIGSFYFVSGSYPHANQFYYSPDRARTYSLPPEYATIREQEITNPMLLEMAALKPVMSSAPIGSIPTKSQTIDHSLRKASGVSNSHKSKQNISSSLSSSAVAPAVENPLHAIPTTVTAATMHAEVPPALPEVSHSMTPLMNSPVRQIIIEDDENRDDDDVDLEEDHRHGSLQYNKIATNHSHGRRKSTIRALEMT